jgi:hypothetical protein
MREDAASKLPAFLRIPVGYGKSADPIEINPFAKNDPRHGVWDGATLRAEEEVSRLNSKLIARSKHLTWNGETALEIAINQVCENALPKFDIWAKRNIQVVWSTQDAEGYALWLVNYAEAWLKSYREQFRVHRPPIVSTRNVLHELRTRLIGRIEWWKAEARRYLGEQKAAFTKAVSDHKLRSIPIENAGPSSHRPNRKRTKLQIRRDGVVFGALQAELKGLKYCSHLDRCRIRPRQEWQSDGCPDTYSAAYKQGKIWQKKIQDQKHRFFLRYNDTPLTERERLIEGVTTRPTR